MNHLHNSIRSRLKSNLDIHKLLRTWTVRLSFTPMCILKILKKVQKASEHHTFSNFSPLITEQLLKEDSGAC